MWAIFQESGNSPVVMGNILRTTHQESEMTCRPLTISKGRIGEFSNCLRCRNLVGISRVVHRVFDRVGLSIGLTIGYAILTNNSLRHQHHLLVLPVCLLLSLSWCVVLNIFPHLFNNHGFVQNL